MTTRARVHTLILWFILVDYGVYSVAVAFEKMSGFFAIGSIFTLLAAIGVATRKTWSKPLVWTMGVLIVVEWLAHTLMAYRGGVFHAGSWVEFCIALVPGIAMASVVGYCCYVVDAYVVRRRPPPR
jgi:hypothetical protein